MIGLNPTTCIKQSSHAALAAGMAVLMALAACGGGGGSTATSTTTTTTTGSPSIAGSVVDGRVKNATLTLYSDQAMTQQVGSGTTDATGAFNITLSVKTAPDPIYIKSVGGIDLDTGMPAPTMCFVGNTGGANKLTRFHVTPLTNRVCKLARGKGMTLSAAQTRVRTDFGLSSNTGAGAAWRGRGAAGWAVSRIVASFGPTHGASQFPNDRRDAALAAVTNATVRDFGYVDASRVAAGELIRAFNCLHGTGR